MGREQSGDAGYEWVNAWAASARAETSAAMKGEAPAGLAVTGDPAFQAFWTILHVPTITLPTHRGPTGLPVGLQVVAPRYEDERLFACARWMERGCVPLYYIYVSSLAEFGEFGGHSPFLIRKVACPPTCAQMAGLL